MKKHFYGFIIRNQDLILKKSDLRKIDGPRTSGSRWGHEIPNTERGISPRLYTFQKTGKTLFLSISFFQNHHRLSLSLKK
ncbi:hypothetical protein [Akkermansia sp.]|uniref:hypothetical protein n=1 Tax=Akkermansia sp. TaxID=1872421 RepID=UPI0025C2738B|nr:hypothetical protein [Akkermansia sp.]